jgi:transcriptional regulator with XRE-family HTH domain
MPQLGNRIAQARNEKGWTQAELARQVRRINPALDTKVSTISSIEIGKSQSTTILNELAIALGVSETWLRTGKGPKQAEQVSSTEVDLILEHVMEAIKASYEAIGVPDAGELAQLVLESAQEPLVAGETPNLRERRMIVASLVRRFLLTKQSQKPDA